MDPENMQSRPIVLQPLGTDPWILYKVYKLNGGVGTENPAIINQIKFTANENFGLLVPQILYGEASATITSNPYIQNVQTLYKADFAPINQTSLTFNNLKIPTPQMNNAAVYIMLASSNIFS